MSRMTSQRHLEVAQHAGRLLVEPLPPPGFVDEFDDLAAAAGVYIVCTRTDEVLYVGSARRPRDPNGLVKRIREHLRDSSRRTRWLRVWLIPLTPDASVEQVRFVEGAVGLDLGCPENKRLPRILPVHTPTARAS